MRRGEKEGEPRVRGIVKIVCICVWICVFYTIVVVVHKTVYFKGRAVCVGGRAIFTLRFGRHPIHQRFGEIINPSCCLTSSTFKSHVRNVEFNQHSELKVFICVCVCVCVCMLGGWHWVGCDNETEKKGQEIRQLCEHDMQEGYWCLHWKVAKLKHASLLLERRVK